MYLVADWVKTILILREYTAVENNPFRMPMGLRVAYTVIKVPSNLSRAEMPRIVDNLTLRKYKNHLWILIDRVMLMVKNNTLSQTMFWTKIHICRTTKQTEIIWVPTVKVVLPIDDWFQIWPTRWVKMDLRSRRVKNRLHRKISRWLATRFWIVIGLLVLIITLICRKIWHTVITASTVNQATTWANKVKWVWVSAWRTSIRLETKTSYLTVFPMTNTATLSQTMRETTAVVLP